MTEVLTIRIAPALLGRAEARAAELGLGRAKYVRGLIEQDLCETATGSKHAFVSEDLVGMFKAPAPRDSATNARVRKILLQRTLSRRETNR